MLFALTVPLLSFFVAYHVWHVSVLTCRAWCVSGVLATAAFVALGVGLIVSNPVFVFVPYLIYACTLIVWPAKWGYDVSAPTACASVVLWIFVLHAHTAYLTVPATVLMVHHVVFDVGVRVLLDAQSLIGRQEGVYEEDDKL